MSEQEESLKTKIILASASPRRKEIFANLGLDFEVIAPCGIPEKTDGDPLQISAANSIEKARQVLKKIRGRDCRCLISGFDTIVCRGGRIFGKPSDIKEAYSFIEALSGGIHRVITGMCIIDSITGRYETGSETTEIGFRDLRPEEIENYLKREYVLDKAGAYNIAGPGALLIDMAKGCFFNAMGVPVFKFIGLLERFDYKILGDSKE